MTDYFKNTELAALYGISEATVRNWAKLAQKNKYGLEIVERNGRVYVAKSIHNIPIVEKLVRKNRKYRNALAARTIVADTRFYEVYGKSGAYDIVRNLELHNEVPHQYVYFEEGVRLWEESVNESLGTEGPNMLGKTIELLNANHSYIDARLSNFSKVNVIDIGVGNAVPVKELLARFIKKGNLGRYVAVDFSEGMLRLAKLHLDEWFGDEIQFESHRLDIAYERFTGALANDYLKPNQDTLNLVLFLGATPNNFRVPSDAFRTICESMGPNDLFIYTDKLEPPNAPPEWFEDEAKSTSTNKKRGIAQWHRVVFDLIGIDDTLYDFEVGFDIKANQRYARARFKVALTLIFKFQEGTRIVNFEKGDTIILWRCLQTTQESLMSLLGSAGFHVSHTSQSEDHNYILTISEVQPSRWNV